VIGGMGMVSVMMLSTPPPENIPKTSISAYCVIMRNDSAVSELVGAVLLIAVVIGGMGMVSVMMLSTPPPENIPKTSISAYCVACTDDVLEPADDHDGYEILIYNGGGESLKRNMLSFFLKTRDKISKRPVATNLEIEPYIVYNDIPEYCGSEFGDSPSFRNERWSETGTWVGGQTLRFFLSVPDGEEPMGINIRYSPYTSNIVATDFSSYRDRPGEWTPAPYFPGDIPEDELPPYSVGILPVLISNGLREPDGRCNATFSYVTDSDYDIPVAAGYLPANEFIGSGISPDMGQRTSFTTGDSGHWKFSVRYSEDLVWKLGRTTSTIAVCNDG